MIFRRAHAHSKTERKAGETKKAARERKSNTPVRQETEKGGEQERVRERRELTDVLPVLNWFKNGNQQYWTLLEYIYRL